MELDLFSANATSQLTVSVQTLIAGVFGGLVGYERDRSGKGIGIGELLVDGDGNGDHTRTLHAVITGVGFIGAGAILHSDRGTQGVTTATSVFLVAVIGAAVGVGLPIVGFTVTLLALIVLRVLGAWQHSQTSGIELADPTE